jgi:hypothetical protein
MVKDSRINQGHLGKEGQRHKQGRVGQQGQGNVAQGGRGQEDEPQAQVSYFTCVLPSLFPNAFLASGLCAQRSQGKGQNKNPTFPPRNPL